MRALCRPRRQRRSRSADTTGMANPRQVEALVKRVRERWPDLELALHFHNTRGMGLANVLAGLAAGVTRYEGCLGGLGGCPFAPGATGNICTEDLVHMLHCMGYDTGVDLDLLARDVAAPGRDRRTRASGTGRQGGQVDRPASGAARSSRASRPVR